MKDRNRRIRSSRAHRSDGPVREERVVATTTVRRGVTSTLVLALLLLVPVAASADGAGSDEGLKGAWLVKVTTTETLETAWFFEDGGVFHTSAAIPLTGLAADGVGAWEKTGNHSYSATIYQQADDMGFCGGKPLWVKVQQSMDLDGDTFTGDATLVVFCNFRENGPDVCDPGECEDNPVPFGASTLWGRRIIVE